MVEQRRVLAQVLAQAELTIKQVGEKVAQLKA